MDIAELKKVAEEYCNEAEEHEDHWTNADRLRIMDFVLYVACIEEKG